MDAFNFQQSVEISGDQGENFYELLSVLASLEARPVFGLLFGVREALQTELQGATCHTTEQQLLSLTALPAGLCL